MSTTEEPKIEEKPQTEKKEETPQEEKKEEKEDTTIDMGKELESMKQKMLILEEESEKIKQLQEQAELELGEDSKESIDSRSVYVGNVDYGTTPEELQTHFKGCGTINRVTIICDKFTGHPKGFAYVEFLEKESIENAIKLNESLFRGRQLKVISKRTNVPGVTRGRGGGFRGRGGYRGRGGFRGRRPYYHPYGGF